MTAPVDQGREPANSDSSTVQTAAVWARAAAFEGNNLRQLLVPKSGMQVAGTAADLASNDYGAWPVVRSEQSEVLAIRRSPTGAIGTRATWIGPRDMDAPDQVVASWTDAVSFSRRASGLRRPQVGALHAVIGYWTSGLAEPGIVVMPTGTGKTDTMIAILVAERLPRLLVVVPTAALRKQIAAKFESLGVLQRLKVVTPAAKRPVVGRLEHGIADVVVATEFAHHCNVLVVTPNALSACSPEAQKALLSEFTHLMVDEAHHAPAPSWASIIEAFEGKPTLLFTATPYREDRRSLPGRIIFRYPLRAAQADGYYSTIDYKAVLCISDSDVEGTDLRLATEAVARLREDLTAGYDHLLMARVGSINRAKEVVEIYRKIAGELAPVAVYHHMRDSARRQVLADLDSRASRIVVCVDMLGEGFDLPQLKIAAIHNPKRALGPMIQFVGRFTRTDLDASLGNASVFVAKEPEAAISPLRELFVEDPDWNAILRDITERRTAAIEELSEFENSFTDGPEEVPVTSLTPKLSAVAHRAPSSDWDPDQIREVYPEELIVGGSIGHGADGSIAWFVLQNVHDVPWGDIKSLEDTTYELIVMYFDHTRRILYVYSSQKSGNFTEVARAVLGNGSQLIAGADTYRVLSGLDRVVPTNVGLLDVMSQFRRFSMHVGPDVMEALDTAQEETKSQTHIATSAWEDGEHVSISAANSGRFWSAATARNLKDWTSWCDHQGGKLLDSAIRHDDVIKNFVIPADVTERPDRVLLAVEWPWQIYVGVRSIPTLEYSGRRYQMPNVDLVVSQYSRTGPFAFTVATNDWRLDYQGDVTAEGITYRAVGADATVGLPRSTVPLSEWLNVNKPTLILEGDAVIVEGDRLLARRTDLPPFPLDELQVLGWSGVNIRVESQTETKRIDSIQHFVARHLLATRRFDVLLDDDGSGEAADLVGLTVQGGELLITLVHCKYAHGDKPGARLDDLYEVVGQAVRSARWRRNHAKPLLANLARRAVQKQDRTQVSPYEVGGPDELYKIRETAPQLRLRVEILIAQPGLSKRKVTSEQLQLLAGAAAYSRTTAAASFSVLCSA